MKKSLIYNFAAASILILTSFNELKSQNDSSKYIITKESGRIIQGYKAFEDFLKTDKSWENYKKLVLDAYPEIQSVHRTAIRWGGIDSLKFPEELKNYRTEDWEKYSSRYDEETVNFLYDSIIEKGNKILKPVNKNPVDLCLFLPYSGCFVLPEDDRSIICISLLINPDDIPKIMAHEYAHTLHLQRCPDEPLKLKREIVSEGMAVYLTTLIVRDLDILNAIPFMPDSSVKWCFENEQLIKNYIKADLNDSTDNLFKKYISDGSYAAPPEGFVQKTGYFAGYRIVKACIEKGMKLEEICSLNSDVVIAKSGYFNE